MSWPLLVAGIVVLVAVLIDVVTTTLSTVEAAGPITSRLVRLWWGFVRRVAGGPTSPLLTSAGPLLLLATAGLWALGLWAGWSLVFAADPSAVVTSPGGEAADGWSRVYYAGMVTFTLGTGDVAPQGAPWQVLSIVASGIGLGVVTAAITYVLPVVTAVTERSRTAGFIHALGDDPYELVIAAWQGGGLRHLEQLAPQLGQELLLTAERHVSYPILHVFHPASPEAELRVQVSVLDEAVTLLQHGVHPSVRPHRSTLTGLRAAVRRLLERAPLANIEQPPDPLSLRPLRDAGVPTTDDATFAAALADLGEHRRRLRAYAHESRWPSPVEP